MKTPQAALFALFLVFAGNTYADDLFSWLQSHRNTTAKTEKSRPKVQAGQRYSGQVTAVSDGDTLRLTDSHGHKHKIRLAYIDAPELQQAHGHAARKALEAAVLGQTVEVRVFDTDRYHREVAQVWSNQHDINLLQILHGHAWHYVSIAKRKQNKTDYAAYAYAEAYARNGKLGLWQNRSAQAPWAFRQAQREQQNGFSWW
ncbi:thermonuclease family protein [Neisseria sp. Dent CA1/247]|uniref:thermonuclease family protein n=1 Tax=Neisseria sp. Dent CA1/247 TaxID=2912675 RepID=UPI001FD4BD3C|nr:thermonuclease family protein [Neisseria sp. Dent CA1/247]UOO75989.1 thermonuclease family protein [Neisseria sp. Dent CA1/247]